MANEILTYESNACGEKGVRAKFLTFYMPIQKI